jgi:hypothetical protein
MRRFNITCTGYFNRRHRRLGHLYQGRRKSILADKKSYLSELSRYIHLNPVRTRELESEEAKVRWHYLLDYPWSTLPGYLNIGSLFGIGASAVSQERERLESRMAEDETVQNRIPTRRITAEGGCATLKQPF